MDAKERKPLRLDNFDYGEIGCYFVTLCTYNRQPLFELEHNPVGHGQCAVPLPDANTPVQNQIIHKWIGIMQAKFDAVQIEQYVIMPDHLHLIINIRERHIGRSLPDVMRFFKTMTTNEYIRAVKSGKLPPFHKRIWQKSYYDHVVRNQQDYNDIWAYIENNPIKWMQTHDDS